MASGAFGKALSRVRECVEGAGQQGPVRLPTVAQLAAGAGVSKDTMSRAVRQFVGSGVLTASPGRGIHAGHRVPVPRAERPEPGSRGPAWRRVLDGIQRDLAKGTLGDGERLPTTKTLVERYGACSRTVRRALEAAVAAGAIVPYMRGYRRKGLAARRSYGMVLLVALAEESGAPAFRTPRTAELYRAFEYECSHHGLGLTFVPVRTGTVDGQRGVLGARMVLGSIVCTAGIDTARTGRLIGQCADRGRPVAVLDEVETAGQRHATGVDGRCRWFTISGSAVAGRTVGRYLVGLGHHRVAYLSSFRPVGWDRQRLLGLREAFGSAGMPGAVLDVHGPEAQDGGYEPDPLEAPLARIRETLGAALAMPTRAGGPVSRMSEAMVQLRGVVMAEVYRGRSAPLFRRAMAEAGVTAWVGSNDWVALEALDFLAREGRRVPRDVSVVGFDDTMEAFYRRLTSYSFNSPAVARAMVTHIVQPGWPSHGSGAQGPLEVEGFVNVRGTTAQPG